MGPLLELYSEVDLETASIHAATIEEITYGKVMQNGALQVASTAKKSANWLLQKAGLRFEFDETPAKSTAQCVIERAEYWKQQPINAVQKRVIALLSERLSVGQDGLGPLSVKVITEAAKEFGISEDLLLSQQAERVAEEYIKECVKGTQELLRKQGYGEVAATEAALSDRIAQMSASEKLEIQRALGLHELSGKSLRDTFLRSGVPLAGIAAVQATGFGAYIALTTVMHAVFTSMLGITLPFVAYTSATSALSVLTGPLGIMLSFAVGALGYLWGQRKIERNQCAMVVFVCVLKANRQLSPRTLSLPSSHGRKLLGTGKDEIVTATQEEVAAYQDLVSSQDLSQFTANLFERAKDEAESEKRKREAAERKLADAEQSLRGMIHRVAADNNLQNSLETQICSLRRRVEELTVACEESAREIERTEAALAQAQSRAENAHRVYESRLTKRKSELEMLWSIHFPTVKFAPQAIRWAAEQDFGGRLEIERALKELADADDPVQLSRSKMHTTGEHHSGFTIPHGVPCRIFYTASGKNIRISRMCKRKDC